MDIRCRIELLGGLCVRQGDRLITRFSTHKTGALLAYLAYHLDRLHPREVLIELLWPECDLDAGRARLSVALSSLRHQLEPPGVPAGAVIQADRASVRLNRPAITTDVMEFEAGLELASRASSPAEQEQALLPAVALYRGPLLPGYYEDWIAAEQERLAERYLQSLRQLIGHAEHAGDLPRALDYARRAMGADPLREESYQDLMRLYVAAGQPSAALRQFHELERLLEEELGQAPSAASRALADEIGRSAFRRSGVQAFRRSGVQAEPRRPEAEPQQPKSKAQLSPPRAAAASASSLPLQLTTFFGRETELAQLRALLLRDGIRLVTLTGSGGSGKTRLALQVAARLVEALGGALSFVPLADVADPQRIADAVRDALRLPRSPHLTALEQVVDALSPRPSLLLLDNLEHLLEMRRPESAMRDEASQGGAALVRTLLERVPTLKCLVTSRQPLGLEGEHEFLVLPLPIPDESVKYSVLSVKRDGPPQQDATPPPQHSTLNTQHLTPEHLLLNESVQLFVDRAQAVRPDFQVTVANAGAVAELCRRLEGIPLAIVLAASRAQVLTPAQMVAQLAHRFGFLVSRRRDAAPRHRSLRAAIDWSYQLLAPELQRFFARLSVFRGGWTLEAAEAVCVPLAGSRFESSRFQVDDGTELSNLQPVNLQPGTRPQGAPDVLDYLAQLRERNLVLAEESAAAMRFCMLETLREFGAEQQSPEERTELERRHAAYYLALVEAAEVTLHGALRYAWTAPSLTVEEGEWLDHLTLEQDNCRAALAWALEREPKFALRFAAAPGPFWELDGHYAEGIEGLRHARERCPEGPRELRAKALWWEGRLAYRQGDLRRAIGPLEESVELSRELGDPRGLAEKLQLLGHMRSAQGDARCHALRRESEALCRAAGDKKGLASALVFLALDAHRQGDHATAHARLDESLEIARELGDKPGVAFALHIRGMVVYSEGDYAGARALFEQSMAISRELAGQTRSPLSLLHYTFIHLAHVGYAQGTYAEAETLLRESLTACRQVGTKHLIEECLEALAAVATAQHHPERAVRLFAAAASLRQSIGRPDRKQYGREVAAVREALGEPHFAAAWAAGRALTWQQAADEALHSPQAF